MSNNIILEMKNINKSFPGVRALQGVDFKLNKGEIHALMGENGAGKSTLIKVLTGVYEKDEGHIYIDGSDKEPESVPFIRKSHYVPTYQLRKICISDVPRERPRIGKK